LPSLIAVPSEEEDKESIKLILRLLVEGVVVVVKVTDVPITTFFGLMDKLNAFRTFGVGKVET